MPYTNPKLEAHAQKIDALKKQLYELQLKKKLLRTQQKNGQFAYEWDLETLERFSKEIREFNRENLFPNKEPPTYIKNMKKEIERLEPFIAKYNQITLDLEAIVETIEKTEKKLHQAESNLIDFLTLRKEDDLKTIQEKIACIDNTLNTYKKQYPKFDIDKIVKIIEDERSKAKIQLGRLNLDGNTRRYFERPELFISDRVNKRLKKVDNTRDTTELFLNLGCLVEKLEKLESAEEKLESAEKKLTNQFKNGL